VSAHVVDDAVRELARLRAINAELLAALKGYQDYDVPLQQRQQAAMKAIQHAESAS